MNDAVGQSLQAGLGIAGVGPVHGDVEISARKQFHQIAAVQLRGYQLGRVHAPAHAQFHGTCVALVGGQKVTRIVAPSVQPQAVQLIPEVHARRYRALAVKCTDHEVNVVMSDPADLVALDALEAIAPKEERCKEIRATVASLRVDSIAAAGFGSSRSRAAADIAADKLKLNWQSVKNASQTVKEGDVLSMRGRGRLEVAEVRGQTKKGRTGVLLKRYL